jgi:hypothetical protein
VDGSHEEQEVRSEQSEMGNGNHIEANQALGIPPVLI